MSDLDCNCDGLDCDWLDCNCDCCDCDCDFGGCLSTCFSSYVSHSGGHQSITPTGTEATAAATAPAAAASAPSAIASPTASRHAIVLLAGVGVRGRARGGIRREVTNIVAAGGQISAAPLGRAGVVVLVKESAAWGVFPLDLNLAAGVRHQEATCPLELPLPYSTALVSARFKKVIKCAV